MIPSIESLDKSVDRLVDLFDDLFGGLAPGIATVGSKRTKNDDGTIVWLKPSEQQAAEFSAHIEDGNSSLVDVSFGSGTTYELPWESNLPKGATFEMMIDVVKDMGLAVIAGRCEERFGFLGVRGTIRVDTNNVYRSSHYFHGRLFPKTIRYAPYSPTPFVAAKMPCPPQSSS